MPFALPYVAVVEATKNVNFLRPTSYQRFSKYRFIYIFVLVIHQFFHTNFFLPLALAFSFKEFFSFVTFSIECTNPIACTNFTKKNQVNQQPSKVKTNSLKKKDLSKTEIQPTIVAAEPGDYQESHSGSYSTTTTLSMNKTDLIGNRMLSIPPTIR